MLPGSLMTLVVAAMLTKPIMPAPDCDDLVRWAGRVESEYPGLDLMNTRWGAQFMNMVLPLFDDGAFIPAFGRAFDAMNEGQRRSALQELRNCQRQHPQLRWAATLLGNGFISPNPTWGYAKVAGEVVAMRAARAELEELRTLSADAESADGTRLDRLVELRARAPANLARIWPGERASYETALASAAGTADRHAVGQRVDSAIASAQGAGPEEALRALDAATSGGRRGLDPAALQELERLAAERAVHERTLIDSMRARLQRLPDGAAGIEAGNGWIREHERLRPIVRSPEFMLLTGEFGERRDAQLLSLAPALADEVATASSLVALQQTVGRYAFLESDWRRPALQGIAEQVHGRRVLLEKLAALGVDMPELTGMRTRAAARAEPTAEEMYDAVRANIEAVNAVNDALYADCAERGRDVDQLTGIMCSVQWIATAGAGPLRTAIATFRKNECRLTDLPGTFECEFRMGLDMNVPGLRSWAGDLLRSGAMGSSIGVFMETPSGFVLVKPVSQEQRP